VTLGVLVAMSDRWESAIVTALDRSPGLSVVRRCADLADLLAAAAAGLAPVAVVSADLRLLDRSALDQLGAFDVVVVGVHAPGDEAGERRLHQLGISSVLSTDVPAETLAERLESLGNAGGQRGRSGQDGRSAAPIGPAPPGSTSAAAAAPGAAPTGPAPPGADARAVDVRSQAEIEEALAGVDVLGATGAGERDRAGRVLRQPERTAAADVAHAADTTGADALPADAVGHEPGSVLAVWGPAGAPGRTTVAVNLAAELAAQGSTVVLVDADTYGGCVAQVLSLLDEAPGIAAATRAAEHGTLELATLARLAPEAAPRLRVLTGIPKAERWTEVRSAPLEQVLAMTRRLARWTVVDCGFNLEDDEELSYDTLAPRRNAATLTALSCADHLIAVGAADPIGLQRLVRGLQELGTVSSPRPMVVVNKVRSGAVGKDPERRIAEALARFAGVERLRFLPADPGTLDAVVLAGRTLAEGAPQSTLRHAFSRLAREVCAPDGEEAGGSPRRFRARRRH